MEVSVATEVSITVVGKVSVRWIVSVACDTDVSTIVVGTHWCTLRVNRSVLER